jgi:hypothetical protein
MLKMSPEVAKIVDEAYAKAEELRVLHTHTPLARCAAVIWFVLSELEATGSVAVRRSVSKACGARKRFEESIAVPNFWLPCMLKLLCTTLNRRLMAFPPPFIGVSDATVQKCHKKICTALAQGSVKMPFPRGKGVAMPCTT